MGDTLRGSLSDGSDAGRDPRDLAAAEAPDPQPCEETGPGADAIRAEGERRIRSRRVSDCETDELARIHDEVLSTIAREHAAQVRALNLRIAELEHERARLIQENAALRRVVQSQAREIYAQGIRRVNVN